VDASAAQCGTLGGEFGERFGLVKDASESSRRRSGLFRILDKAEPPSPIRRTWCNAALHADPTRLAIAMAEDAA